VPLRCCARVHHRLHASREEGVGLRQVHDVESDLDGLRLLLSRHAAVSVAHGEEEPLRVAGRVEVSPQEQVVFKHAALRWNFKSRAVNELTRGWGCELHAASKTYLNDTLQIPALECGAEL
jgi:hypothetical protein